MDGAVHGVGSARVRLHANRRLQRGTALAMVVGMTTNTIAYRDSYEGASLRYADLLSRAVGPRLRTTSTVLASRTARIAAGATGLAAAGVLAALTIHSARSDHGDAGLTKALLAAWPAMAIAYALGYASSTFRVGDGSAPRRTGDALTDLARLEENEHVAVVRRHVAREAAGAREWASIALPMMACALLAPLTIHLFVSLCVNPMNDFDAWIKMSLAIVGHAHIALALMCLRFANRASSLGSAALERARPSLEWWSWGVTVIVSAIPGIVFFLLPPAITAVTGLFFNPVMFRWMTRTVIAERAKLASA